MLSACANASYVSETWHKNTNKTARGIKDREPHCFALCCPGILQVVQTPHCSNIALTFWNQSGPVCTDTAETFTSVNVQVILDTDQAPALFPDMSSTDTPVFSECFRWEFMLYQSQICLIALFCRLSTNLGSPHHDRCVRFSQRTGNFHRFFFLCTN